MQVNPHDQMSSREWAHRHDYDELDLCTFERVAVKRACVHACVERGATDYRLSGELEQHIERVYVSKRACSVFR